MKKSILLLGVVLLSGCITKKQQIQTLQTLSDMSQQIINAPCEDVKTKALAFKTVFDAKIAELQK